MISIFAKDNRRYSIHTGRISNIDNQVKIAIITNEEKNSAKKKDKTKKFFEVSMSLTLRKMKLRQREERCQTTVPVSKCTMH